MFENGISLPIVLFVYEHGRIVKLYSFKDKQKAMNMYARLSQSINHYTQVVVNGCAYTTAQAEKYFDFTENRLGIQKNLICNLRAGN